MMRDLIAQAATGRLKIMGILNVTPDSFSDGGRFVSAPTALAQARRMVAEGAEIIDIGGESTRPGAAAVSLDEELERVVPVIEAIRNELDVAVSVDTSKPGVMKAAVAAGAGLINDVRALADEGALAMAAELKVPVCLMHMQGQPRTMQHDPHYHDVVGEVLEFLGRRVAAAEAAGVAREDILIDPGFGFGKSLEHNLSLLHNLERFQVLNLPVLVGISRKSMLGTLLDGAAADERLFASVGAAVIAALKGATILRVHDVAETRDALRVCQAVLDAD